MFESIFNKRDFIKKILQHRCFPVKFTKFLQPIFLQKTSGGYFWLHLIFYPLYCLFMIKLQMYDSLSQYIVNPHIVTIYDLEPRFNITNFDRTNLSLS